jgi:peptidoglycan hydrolase-like protein with peptidoglycan-binding domain
MTAGGGAALAASGSGSVLLHRGDRGSTIAQVQRALGITADGVYGPATRRAVISFQRSHGLIVDGIVGPQTLGALGLSSGSGSSGSSGSSGDSPGSSGTSSELQKIASCESSGNPSAVSPDGTYRGKYQFDYGTWASVGGHGDPAAAPAAEQDMRAQMLLDRAGTSPWPVCG